MEVGQTESEQVAKFDHLCFVPISHIVEEENLSQKSSDLHMCANA